MDLKELKAQAYDIISHMEYLRIQLSNINQKIAATTQKEDAEKKADE